MSKSLASRHAAVYACRKAIQPAAGCSGCGRAPHAAAEPGLATYEANCPSACAGQAATRTAEARAGKRSHPGQLMLQQADKLPMQVQAMRKSISRVPFWVRLWYRGSPRSFAAAPACG